jgi:hypothetical protein
MSHFISQQEADNFFSMLKYPEDDIEYIFPSSGEKLIIPFFSEDKRENFLFDIYRGRIKITKVKYQNRIRKAYILRRLDFDGAPHLNPLVESVPLPFLEQYNGIEIPSPHLHFYVEGFGDKWALPAEEFIDLKDNDIYEIMENFFNYCNVAKFPNIKKTLLL